MWDFRGRRWTKAHARSNLKATKINEEGRKVNQAHSEGEQVALWCGEKLLVSIGLKGEQRNVVEKKQASQSKM